MRQPTPKIEPAFFDLQGASEYLGGALSIRTLRRLISEPGGLAYHQAGRSKILIKRADLDAWLEARRREPVDLGTLADEAMAELGMG
jgi:excisionase family DNA binding protein